MFGTLRVKVVRCCRVVFPRVGVVIGRWGRVGRRGRKFFEDKVGQARDLFVVDALSRRRRPWGRCR